MIKALIFDWGGVLGPDANRNIADLLAKEYSINKDELLHEFSILEPEYSIGPDSDDYYIRISKKFNIPSEIIKDKLNSMGPWEVFDWAKNLKDKGYKVFLFSNQMKPRTDALKKEHDLSFFDQRFISNELGMQKPDKKFFEYVYNRINIPLDQCIFIDDKKKNIEVSEELGVKGILFLSPPQLRKELANMGIYIDN